MKLDKECEKALKHMQNYEKENRQRQNHEKDNIHMFFSEKQFSKQVIEKLSESHMINILEILYEDNENIYHIELSRDGELYFKNKIIHRTIELCKFFLPISISIAAIIVSIVK